MADKPRKPNRRVLTAIVIAAAIFWAVVVLFRIVLMANTGGAVTNTFT